MDKRRIIPLVSMGIDLESNVFYVYAAGLDRKLHLRNRVENPVNILYLFILMMRAYIKLEQELRIKTGLE